MQVSDVLLRDQAFGEREHRRYRKAEEMDTEEEAAGDLTVGGSWWGEKAGGEGEAVGGPHGQHRAPQEGYQ